MSVYNPYNDRLNAGNGRLTLTATSIPPFNPGSISNLAIWLDGDRVIQSGSSVTEWPNQAATGTTYTFTQTGSRMPAYNPTASNGHGGLTFDGVDDLLVGNAGVNALTNNIGALTVYVVWKAADNPSANEILYILGTGSSATRAGAQKSTANLIQLNGRRLDADANQSVGATTIGTDRRISCFVYDWTNSDAYVYDNGPLVASTTSFQTSGNTSATNSSFSNIGAFNTSTNFLNGTVYEFIVYLAAHTSAPTRASVFTGLGAKHGIAVS